MKVKIGPYKGRAVSNFHTRYMEKKHGPGFAESETWFERFLEWLEDRVQDLYNLTINQILDRRKRKESVKIDRYDTWDASHTLAMVIYPTLRALQEAECGAPDVANEDVPEHLRRDNHYPVDSHGFVTSDDAWFDRWKYVLDEMTWTFNKLSQNDWEQEHYYDGLIEGMKQFPQDEGIGKQLGMGDFSVDEESLDRDNKRIEEGLRLFGRYFKALWT